MSHSASVEPSETEATIPSEEAKLEMELHLQIPRLWVAHRECKRETKQTKAELVQVRRELSSYLFEMKSLLARTGRGGMWASFLREQRIPRATADRYVATHEASEQKNGNKRLSEAIEQPMHVQIGRFIERIEPQLLRMLKSSETVFMFVNQVLNRMPDANFDVYGNYMEVFYGPKEPPAS